MKKKDKNQNFTPPTESELIDRYIERLEEKEKETRTKKYKPRFKQRRRFVLPVCLSIAGILCLFAALFYFDILKLPENLLYKSENTTVSDHNDADTLSNDTQNDISSDLSDDGEENEASSGRPSKLFGVTVVPDKDISLTNADREFDAIVSDTEENGLTTIFIELNSSVGIVTDTAEGKTAIETGISKAHAKALSVFGVLDVTALTGEDPTDKNSAELIHQKVTEICKIKDLDGIILKGLEYENDPADFTEYMATGTLSGFKAYCENRLTALVRSISNAVKKENGALVLGLICDDVYSTKSTDENGMSVKSDTELLRDKNADVLSWMKNQYFDIVFVDTDTTTNSTDKPFETVAKWWSENTPAVCDLGFMLSSDLAAKGQGEWKNPDQLGRQLTVLNEINRYVFCFNSYSALKNDESGAANLVYKYLTGGIAEDYVMRELTVTSPAKTDFTTYENSVAIIGASDPNFELLLNGEAVVRTADGYFSLQLELKTGKNTFTLTHKGTTKTFNITYRYVILKDYSPSSAVKLEGGSSLMVKATARTGSTVTASLNGKTTTLQMVEGEEYSDFSTYSGSLDIPDGYTKDTSLGNVVFKGSHNGISESFKGGSVTVKKDEVTASADYTPSTGGYIGVGNTLIAEVVKYQVETFDGDVVNDLSQPYNNYLPKGTLDYCEEKTTYDPSSGNTYRLLRYGKRVYTTSKGVANIRTLRGSLPATNKLSVKSVTTEGSHTKLTLKTDWKAPFKLQLLPQKYQSATGSERGTISSATFNYIDITFCYASELGGSFEGLENSPVFSKVQIIKNTSDYTLRLYLERTGAFHGWNAEYDSSGNLVFEFLNPSKATVASNKYGGRLDGITIVVDAGHGGSDGGAVGSVAALDEANRNLVLAEKVKEKLESIGAKVVMTRTSDTSMTSDERILKVKNAKADLAVSIHRNSATNVSARGFSSHYFNPYTKSVADKIAAATKSKGVYTKTSVKWHVFYLSRISDCPVVLTENGFMSNSDDFNNMKSDSWNDKCADAIVEGVVDYFLSIG